MTDQELIEGTLRGEHDAFGQLIQRYQRLVEAAAYGATGRHDLVDDIVQDTFVTAWRTIDRLRDGNSLRSWLYGIARNLGLKAHRSARRTPPLEVDVGLPSALDTIVERERDFEVATALARLPRRYREPLVLFYYEHCSVREVATALAVEEGAAMQRLSRGRRKLGEVLANRVEGVLESKPSRAAVVAAVLLLLPARSASAAIGDQPTTIGAWCAAHWRPIGGVLATTAATALMIAAVSRSREVFARSSARNPPVIDAPALAIPPAPVLPDEQHDHSILVTSPLNPTFDDPEHVYRVISLSGITAAESCARGARAVAMAAYGNDAFHVVNGAAYYEPSAELLKLVNAVGEHVGASCDGEWPEAYVMCEGTLADLRDGTVTCYPHDVFHDPS